MVTQDIGNGLLAYLSSGPNHEYYLWGGGGGVWGSYALQKGMALVLPDE